MAANWVAPIAELIMTAAIREVPRAIRSWTLVTTLATSNGIPVRLAR